MHPKSAGSQLRLHAASGTKSGACVAARLPFDTVVSMVVNDPGLGLHGNSFHTFSAIKVNTSGPTDVFAFATPMKVMLHPNAMFFFENVAGVAVSGYLVKFAGP